jgi:isochorismate synthase
MQWNREPVVEALREGSRRATLLKHDVLVSITLPIEACDLIQLFTAAQTIEPADLFYWEHAADSQAMLGIETAATLQTIGHDYLTDAAAACRALFQDAVIQSSRADALSVERGPILFGGFAFDPLSPRSQLWEGFPDGLLMLPAMLIRSRASATTLSLQAIIKPADHIEQTADVMMTRLDRLQAALNSLSLQPSKSGISNQLAVQDGRSAGEWMKLVEETAEQIKQGLYRKVVLARSIQATSAPDSFSVGSILRRLRASQPGAYRFAIQRGTRCFVGATPEQLAKVEQGKIQTMALAGTASYNATKDSDTPLDSASLWNEKNREEHAIVVETICEALTRVCSAVSAAESPVALKLRNIQHLQTPIQGTLQPGVTILDVLAALHPTPAVGGLPGLAACEMIRANEQLDRGWYAGPVGWVDQHGNGEFAVALRSALVHQNEATLFAGCGIVASSDPLTEYAESSLKFQTMLAALSNDLASAALWLPFINTINLEPTRVER